MAIKRAIDKIQACATLSYFDFVWTILEYLVFNPLPHLIPSKEF